MLTLVTGAVLTGLAERFGPLQYRDVSAFFLERQHYLRSAACEIPGCTTGSRDLVVDHCHRHGWVRGAACPNHNTRLGQVDAVREIRGIAIDFACTQYASHLGNCWPCAGLGDPGPELATAALQAFTQSMPARKHAMMPGVTVVRSGARTAHLALTPERTWCGRSADGMKPVTGRMPQCTVCGDRMTLHAERGYMPSPPRVRPQRQDALF